MAQAARPSARNPSTAMPRQAMAPPVRRPDADAPPRAARVKDVPCPTSSGDRSHSGQCKKASEHARHRSSGGTYSKPDARVKLIPAEDITYVRHRKPFSTAVGLVGLQKRHCRRSVTPPPNSRKVSLARSTPLTQKPTTPAPPVASCLSPRRFETAENRQTVSLNRPSPICKAVQRGTIPPAVLLKESVMNPISPSSVHVLAAYSSKVPLGTKAEPSSKSVITLDNRKLCSTSNWAPLKCQRTRSEVGPIVQKESTVELSLLSPTSVLSIRSTEVCPDTRSRPSSRVNVFDGKCKLASLQPETIIPPTKSVQSTTPAQCVELSNDFEVVPSTKSHISNERQTNQQASINCNMSSEIAKGKVCQDVHPKCPASFTQGAPVILHAKLHKKPYRPEACWKGKFEVIGEITHTCDGLEAHFPLEARFPLETFIKVYEASKQMPEILKLEALPLSHLLPKMFKMEPPDGQDIGLCFISSLQRPNRNFDLLENISSHIGLRTDLGTAELLIFSSKLLTKDDQTKDGNFYFWGVFRKQLRKKQQRSNNHTNNVEISNASPSNGDSHDRSEDIGMNLDLTEGKETQSNKCEIGMKLDATGLKKMERNKPKEIGEIFDMTGDKQIESVICGKTGIKLDLTGDKETNRTNKCLAMLKTPDSYAAVSNAAPAVSFFTGSCSPDSADSPCKSATRAPACRDLVLDSPPGFPLDVPPGFTKAHCGLRTGETAESYIDSSSSLVLDTTGFALNVPPGFTDAHRGLHSVTSPGSENGVSTLFSEKKPFIKLSLNITRPVQTDVPPGFAKLLEVKKEPGLPAVYKATEKIAPIGKVNEMKIKHDKVNVEVEESSEEREFPKTKRLSDILELSSASSKNNTSTALSTPGNCTEVCKSAPPVVPLPETTWEPERQKHCRKRGQQEPPEPSCAADATKRLKVNGRIALNRCVDRRAAQGKLRCSSCTSSSGPMATPSLPASSGGTRTCVVCGLGFPTQ